MKHSARLFVIPMFCIGLLLPFATMMAASANQPLQAQLQTLILIMERIRALKADGSDTQDRNHLALLLSDLQGEIDTCYALLGIARNMSVNDNASIGGTLTVGGAAQFNSTIALANQNFVAGSHQTASRIEWARVGAKGALLNGSNGIESVTRTKVGTYQIVLAPALSNPAITVTAASPQIVANYTAVTSTSTQTNITVSTNGVDAEFGITICGVQ